MGQSPRGSEKVREEREVQEHSLSLAQLLSLFIPLRSEKMTRREVESAMCQCAETKEAAELAGGGES